MKVLLAAFACHPHRGSEPGVGWAVAAGAARAGHDVVLVTQPRHRGPIEAARADDRLLAANLHPVYTGLPTRIIDAWDRYLGLRGIQLYYMAWQLLLWRTARRLTGASRFDVAHHVTLATDWVPSGLAWITGTPLVWGPLGGSERVPPSCLPWLPLRSRVREAIRHVTVDPSRSLLGLAAARRAALVVAQDVETENALRRASRRIIIRPNVFIDEVAPAPGASPSPFGDSAGGTGHHAVFAGRLLGWKGVHLAVDVMSRPELAHWSLHIYGRGPERKALQRRISRLHLDGRVILHGLRPRQEVRAAMAHADAFFYPSFRDAAPWVVGEALGAGCPVVCLSSGAPPILVGEMGQVVVPGPGLPERLAAALLAVESAPRSVQRWGVDLIPAMLDEWYGSVVAASARPDTLGAEHP